MKISSTWLGLVALSAFTAAVAQPEAVRLQLRTKQFSAAAAMLRASAQAGDARSEYLLGLMYADGLGVSPSLPDARIWLQRAAEKSDADAALALAGLLASGTAKERASASAWVARAAREGQTLAQHLAQTGALPLAPSRNTGDARLARELARWAVRNGDEKTLRTVLGLHGATGVDDFGRSLLHEAARAGSGVMVSQLLAAGIAAGPDHFGTTPLMLAAQAELPDAMVALLQQPGALRLRDRGGNDALMYAARAGRSVQVKQLLAAGADLSTVNADSMTALDAALQGSHEQTARLLGEAHARPGTAALLPSAVGVDPLRPGQLYEGWPPLAIAASRNDVAALTQLLAAHPAVDQLTPRGDTALLVAIKSAAASVVPPLLHAGASAAAADPAGRTALGYATARGELPVLDALLAAGVSPDLHGRAEAAPLLVAAADGGREIVRRLLGAGASVQARGRHGLTALMLAAQRDDPAIVAALLAAGADVRARDDSGHGPLHYAAAMGHTQVLDALLEAHAPPDDPPQDPPLLAAVRGGHLEAAQHLLTRGASVRLRTASGDTPLMVAAATGDAPITAALLAAGAEINAQNSAGDSALMLAVRSAHREVCQVLLKAGADRRLRNDWHMDALDLARRRNFGDLLTLLQGM
jgi:ankyrin repeat protein